MEPGIQDPADDIWEQMSAPLDGLLGVGILEGSIEEVIGVLVGAASIGSRDASSQKLGEKYNWQQQLQGEN